MMLWHQHLTADPNQFHFQLRLRPQRMDDLVPAFGWISPLPAQDSAASLFGHGKLSSCCATHYRARFCSWPLDCLELYKHGACTRYHSPLYKYGLVIVIKTQTLKQLNRPRSVSRKKGGTRAPDHPSITIILSISVLSSGRVPQAW